MAASEIATVLRRLLFNVSEGFKYNSKEFWARTKLGKVKN
jgi:hypothetical protein